MNNAVGAVVTSMGPQNVDTVLIAGKVMKRNGKLVGVDFDRLTRLGDQARDRLYANANVKNVRSERRSRPAHRSSAIRCAREARNGLFRS